MSRSSQTEADAFVALGANLGDRRRYLSQALDALATHPAVFVDEVAPVYESDAQVLDPGDISAPYLNTVCALRTSLGPRALFDHCVSVERSLGRPAADRGKWLPRTIDLDILTWGASIVDERDLRIPHRRIGQRLFVLVPLHDLAPNLYIPAPFEARVSELLIRCRDRGAIHALPYPLWLDQSGIDDRTDERRTRRTLEYEPR